ncbi:hypothetical protein [Pseudorhodoferax sp.]|uniref:hypothetical protein n=1 Tax=Pseudorhodoferax sp. TaxID=1993553 RepID=UPI002DD64442|nr:hypothetical protein [Pseudorhodoferax sp.]
MNLHTATALLPAWADSHDAHALPARQMQLPSSPTGLAYALHWTEAALSGVLRRHRLRPTRAARYTAEVRPPLLLRERLDKLLDLRPGPADPLLYVHGAVQMLRMQVLADLGVNLGHVRLLRHRCRPQPLAQPAIDAANDQPAAGEQVSCRLLRTVRVSPTEVLLLLETRLAAAGDRGAVVVEDALLVDGLEVAYAVQAGDDDLLRRSVSRMRRRQPELMADGAGVQRRQLYVAPDVGSRFGRLAGERSPVHRWLPAARLAGWKRTQVQPMYLRHLVTREMDEWGADGRTLQIVFTRAVALGQTLTLLRRESLFELIDERGRLVAFGKAGA